MPTLIQFRRSVKRLFEEMANTVDGGTDFINWDGLYKCGDNDGSFYIQVNATAAVYSTLVYI